MTLFAEKNNAYFYFINPFFFGWGYFAYYFSGSNRLIKV